MQDDVQAFSILIRFWLHRDNDAWQGELKEVANNRSCRFHGLPELISLLEDLIEHK